jgi:hypothetical protein
VDCPKCGIAQDDGREDCVSCGIVFARFREAQERAQLRAAQSDVPFQASPTEGIAVSRWIIFAVLLLAVVFGALWTKSRRDARANRDLRKEGMAQLNEINKEGMAERERLEKDRESAREMAGAMTETQKPARRPVGLDETAATRLIEQCFGFQEQATIKLPKSYTGYVSSYAESYPSFEVALERRVVERVGDAPKLWPGPGSGGLNMMDRGEAYEIPLGKRRVREVTSLVGGIDHAEAHFRWMYEGRIAAELLLKGDTYTGVAVFINNGGAWRINGGTVWRQDGDAVRVCKDLS